MRNVVYVRIQRCWSSHRASFLTTCPRTIAAEFATFSSNVAAFVSVASACGVTTTASNSTARAIARLFVVIRVIQIAIGGPRSFQTFADELANDGHRLRRHL